MPKVEGLSGKQRRFVEEYLLDLNAAGAARRAGYSPRNACNIGSQLLKKENVLKAIIEAQQRRSKRVELDQDYVLSGLKTNAERAAQAEPVTNSEGEVIGEYRYEGAVVNRALELLGKHLGLFVDRVQHEGPVLDLALLTDEEVAELRRLLAKAKREPLSDVA